MEGEEEEGEEEEEEEEAGVETTSASSTEAEEKERVNEVSGRKEGVEKTLLHRDTDVVMMCKENN